jgi:hypothetical protein
VHSQRIAFRIEDEANKAYFLADFHFGDDDLSTHFQSPVYEGLKVRIAIDVDARAIN